MNEPNVNAPPEETTGPSTPEDVAILYSWANLPGAKYRDFSASRREYRAQQRARQAEEEHQAELASAQLLEEAARRDMEEAQRALDASHRAEQEAADAETRARAEEAFRAAEANAQREREEAGRRQQSAETLRLRAQAARKEMMSARKRAEEQAARYAEFDAQYREQVDDREPLPGQLDDPYYYTGQVDPAYFASTPGVRTAQATRTSTERKAYVFPVHPGSDEFDAGTLQAYRATTNFAPSPAQDYRSLPLLRNTASLREQDFEREQPAEQERRTGRDPDDVDDAAADNDYYTNSARGLSADAVPFRGFDTAERDLHIRPRALHPQDDDAPAYPQAPVQWRSLDRRSDARSRSSAPADERARTLRQPRTEVFQAQPAEPQAAPPAWLAAQEQSGDASATSFVPVSPAVPRSRLTEATPPQDLPPLVQVPTAASLQRFSTTAAIDSRVLLNDPADANVASEWPGYKVAPAPDTLQQSRERVASRWFALQGRMDGEMEASVLPSHSAAVPVLALVSLSGGVGKTSMAATLGRTLSSLGEKVLLVDTNTHGLLPYYFGARDLRPGAVRTFTPPSGSPDAAVLMAHYELDRVGTDEVAQDRLFADLTERAAGAQRVLVDLSSHGMWLARRLLYTSPFVLVPLAPDMNSILSTKTMESIFADMRDIDGKPVRPFYVLNQYDPALPLHLDVREVLRQSLGDRLLPIMLHRAPAISEALAEGMTVIDYAPGSPATDDYRALAHWIQSLAASGISGGHGARWSER